MIRAVTAERAKEDFSRVMQLVNETDDDVMITGDGGRNYVLVSEENWRSLSETAYLNSIPCLSESILEGGNESLEDCKIYNPSEEW